MSRDSQCHWDANWLRHRRHTDSKKAILAAALLVLAVARPTHAEDPVYVELFNKNATVVSPHTDSEYAELQKDLDVFSTSARLDAMRDGHKDEIRVWVSVATFDPTTEGIRTYGLVAPRDSVVVCEVKGHIVSKGHPTAASRQGTPQKGIWGLPS